MNDSGRHTRKSLRLKNYNYSMPGYYFVTICTRNRIHLFGDISEGRMFLNNIGEIVQKEWCNTPNLRPNVKLDEYVVMPNHIHGIIIITDSGRDVSRYIPTGSEFRSPSNNLGAIIRGFKGAVTTRINKLNREKGTKIWQGNYYDHIIKDVEELFCIRKYIYNNPQKWTYYKFNII